MQLYETPIRTWLDDIICVKAAQSSPKYYLNFSSYLEENTKRLHYKDKIFNTAKQTYITAVNSANPKNHIINCVGKMKS